MAQTPEANTPAACATYYGYNGEEHDSLTGLQYLRARYYSTQTGSFTTQDSFTGILTNALSQNGYTYTHNNPINYADPSGYSIRSSITNTAFNVVSILGSSAFKVKICLSK